MSNPGINRWGLNLFWYNFWYNDKIRQLNIHHDDLINKLIYIYTRFGLFHSKSIFINKYWYLDQNLDIINHNHSHNLTYFRIVAAKNKVLDEINLLKIRNKTKNIYNSKLWILKYQKWIIINFYCFQPLKAKKLKEKKIYKSKDAYIYKTTIDTNLFIRQNLIRILFLNLLFVKNDFFNF